MLTSIQGSVMKLKNNSASVEQAVASKPTTGFDAKWGHYAVNPNDFVRLVYNNGS